MGGKKGKNERGGDGKEDEKKSGEKEEEEVLAPKISYWGLYRYANGVEWIAVIFGMICSVVHGALFPSLLVFWGDIIDTFGPSTSVDDLVDEVTTAAYYILYLAIGAAVTSYFQVALFTFSAQRQSLRIRKLYFQSLIRQEMAWYDGQQPGALSTRISSDIPEIQDALGDKFGSFLQFMGMFFAGIIIGFVYGWQLALLVLGIGPLIGIGGALMSKYIGDAAQGGLGFFAQANSLADEIIRMVKTVIAFETQEVEYERFSEEVDKARVQGEKGARAQGLGMGYTFFVIFMSYPLAFWLGQFLVDEGELSAGDVLIVFFSVITGAMAIGQAAPNIAVMTKGRAAAVKIFEVIDRTPVIDSLSQEGATPTSLQGSISLKNVSFTYPSRPHEPVLHDVSIDIAPKETVALVGQSGCGKSTIVSLVERYYDPVSGSVQLDGNDIRDLNIQWLRSNIALVSQTPALFPTSIEDNIALGKDDATEEEVVEAAKQANAHDFISALPDGYKTNVGDLGTQLSGGQRQRIAIARALIKKPRILLLDEATSALDNESEAIVKEALDRAAKNTTTIVVAHRLSTVFSADKIVVINSGQVMEFGSPQELLDNKGAFYGMVKSQHGIKEDQNGRVMIDLASLAQHEVEAEEEDSTTKQGKKGKGKVMDVALTADLKDGGDDDDSVPEVDRSMVSWVFEENKPERCYLVFGVIGGVLDGCIWGVYAILLSEILSVLNSDNSQTEINRWAIGFIGIAVIAFIVIAMKFTMLGIAGERLTARLRKRAFRAIISKPAGWYDDPRHSRGILTARLATDASLVKGVLGDRFAITVQIIATVVSCLIIACVYCWRVGLVTLACFPLIAIGGALQFKMISGFTTAKAFEQSGKFASQAVEQVRVVAALGRLDSFVQDYHKTLAYPVSVLRRSAQIQGLSFGFSEFCMMGIWALTFWWGSIVVRDGFCNFTKMFTAQMAIIFMGMIVGQVSTFLPDAAKAQQAAKRIYTLLKDHAAEEKEKQGRTYKTPTITGNIELQKVDFTYPSRPDAQVLNQLCLRVQPGKTLALVGHSGCGKSTIISLLEQYYTPTSGVILFDGVAAQEINPKHLRKHVAIVTQQPELFNETIAANISYGLEGEVDQARIEKAAKDANAYDFISEFEDGFNTIVGDKGEQLSGGQRQRIAVARALIRADDIKILLLDEASAALDTESEKLVHAALDRARQGRTTIIVAHRLSTIQNADEIAVIDEGRVVEQGTHDELMKAKGAYYDLVHSQNFVSYDDEGDDNNNNNNNHNANHTTNNTLPNNNNTSSSNVIDFSLDEEDLAWKK